ncbi:unnamed protein product [Nesidiocoris tenuis]|uniref:Homeobox domain-containing protein n=1 Tax=Nesidiocoris tenuis TaxID=355587 RepID=A0A6H5GVS3_9HEMI|nr:unnamed protein product [Nesidiocoris tenuis]CAB0007287.1 unnamed protein product [Nesidiocoris tenuis]
MFLLVCFHRRMYDLPMEALKIGTFLISSLGYIFVAIVETKRPSKEMQVTIARQLGLEPTTVGNFFMNARRRSMDKWKDESETKPGASSSPSDSVQQDLL